MQGCRRRGKLAAEDEAAQGAVPWAGPGLALLGAGAAVGAAPVAVGTQKQPPAPRSGHREAANSVL